MPDLLCTIKKGSGKRKNSIYRLSKKHSSQKSLSLLKKNGSITETLQKDLIPISSKYSGERVTPLLPLSTFNTFQQRTLLYFQKEHKDFAKLRFFVQSSNIGLFVVKSLIHKWSSKHEGQEEGCECAITSRVLYGPEVLQMRIIGWRKTIVTNDTTSTWCTGPCLSFIVLLIKKTHLIDKGC